MSLIIVKQDLSFVFDCITTKEFATDLYKPSANGDFSFHLRKAPFDVKEISTINIDLKGSCVVLRNSIYMDQKIVWKT